jgi:hypothetical protein
VNSVPRIAQLGEDLTGKVCTCSLGRVGVVGSKVEIQFPKSAPALYWSGMGFDGNGLWASNASKAIVVIAESVADYVEAIKAKPSNVLYGKIAVPAPAK